MTGRHAPTAFKEGCCTVIRCTCRHIMPALRDFAHRWTSPGPVQPQGAVTAETHVTIGLRAWVGLRVDGGLRSGASRSTGSASSSRPRARGWRSCDARRGRLRLWRGRACLAPAGAIAHVRRGSQRRIAGGGAGAVEPMGGMRAGQSPGGCALPPAVDRRHRADRNPRMRRPAYPLKSGTCPDRLANLAV